MKIISCQKCGTVIDTDRIQEPDTQNEDDCSVNTEVAVWVSSTDSYEPVIPCPSCETRILYCNGDLA